MHMGAWAHGPMGDLRLTTYGPAGTWLLCLSDLRLTTRSPVRSLILLLTPDIKPLPRIENEVENGVLLAAWLSATGKELSKYRLQLVPQQKDVLLAETITFELPDDKVARIFLVRNADAVENETQFLECDRTGLGLDFLHKSLELGTERGSKYGKLQRHFERVHVEKRNRKICISSPAFDCPVDTTYESHHFDFKVVLDAQRLKALVGHLLAHWDIREEISSDAVFVIVCYILEHEWKTTVKGANQRE